MRLRRIEAVRFGALEGVTVGDLSDTLTVVHGPNEAGKSTLIALVRAVLYGFQGARSKEPIYVPLAGGSRVGRLVFEDESGQWVVERQEGRKRGVVTVRALRGPDRPDLLEEMKRGVDENAYRVVFGFGLDEMAKIEEARKDGDAVSGALYAASAGLRVRPEDIRELLERQQNELYKRQGRTQAINQSLEALSEVRKRIREAKEAGQRFADDRQRLDDLVREHESLKSEAEQAQRATQRISFDLQRASAALERAGSLAKAEEEVETERADFLAQAASIEVDERLSAAADAVESLAHRLPAVAQAAQDSERLKERARAAAAEFERVCASAGLEAEVVRSVAADGPLAVSVRAALEDVTRLEAQLAARREALQRAEAEAERARAVAARALEPAGLDAVATLQDLDRILADVDVGEDVAAPPRERILAIVMVALGLFTFFVGGLWLKETVSLAAGPIAAAVGLLAYLRQRRAGGMAMTGPEGSRRRRLIDIARSAVLGRDAAEAEAERARIEVGSAESALNARKEILARDLAAHGLPRDLDASQAVAALDAVRQAQRHDAEAQTAAQEADRLAAGVAAFVEEARSVVGDAGFARPVESFDDAASALSVLVERLKELRERTERLRETQAQVAQLDARAAELRRQREEAEAQAREVLEGYEQAYASVDGLRALLEDARRVEADLLARKEQVAAEISRLDERLRSLGSDEEAAQARLDEAALVRRIEEAAEEYVVLALGVRLLAAAQERYERERQPDVVKDAQRIFRSITDDRYEAVVVPIGSGRIEVYDRRAAVKDSGTLSKGTAEALYLALRLGLIGRLDGVGPGLPVLIDDVLANFDPERLDGALQAIAGLSRKRQVVYFTCHEDVAARLASAGPPDTVRIELPERR